MFVGAVFAVAANRGTPTKRFVTGRERNPSTRTGVGTLMTKATAGDAGARAGGEVRKVIDGGIGIDGMTDKVGTVGETTAGVGLRHASVGGHRRGVHKEEEQDQQRGKMREDATEIMVEIITTRNGASRCC